MSDPCFHDTARRSPGEHHIMHGDDGCFTVDFISAHNALHRITGFKTEDAARAWVAQTKLLTDAGP